MELGYRTIDADNHYYETRDAFTRYIDPQFAERTPARGERAPTATTGSSSTAGRTCSPSRSSTRPIRPARCSRTCATRKRKAYASSFDAGNMLAAFQNRDERLALMDQQGIEAAILLPSLAVCVERPDPRRRRAEWTPSCVPSTAGWRTTGATPTRSASSASR